LIYYVEVLSQYHSYDFEMDTEKQRQHRRDDARLIESGNARSKQLLLVPTESLTNRVWLEWIRMLKAQLVFKNEISDLFIK